MLPVEVVVRGYLAGSGWKDYRATGSVCGHALPAGLVRVRSAAGADRHPGDEGRDRPRREHRRRDRGRARRRRALRRGRAVALALYAFASAHAEARGILLADTKFELGLDRDGTLVLGDEALTPDSSRFWPADGYAPGGPQPSYDKQFVRDCCESLGWDKTVPRAGAARRRRRRDARPLRRGVRAADGARVRRLPRRSAGGAA